MTNIHALPALPSDAFDRAETGLSALEAVVDLLSASTQPLDNMRGDNLATLLELIHREIYSAARDLNDEGKALRRI
ncbi:MAG: hypothetical protein Q7V31_17305 [Parvibaculum sp.]|uniref:hypothetical protein n=1 Tax=Parvibaculum sp. TaxID=2024848 RepID=UPI002727CF73|nr:hypothetical protein [Parvibaculum sp.]MDO8840671.1 hypothetical protein [Parvibaculum sp.]